MGKYLDQLRQKLPEYPGILGSEQYMKTAVLVPLLSKNDECHLLFQERSDHIRQGGEICFPGGKFEPEYDQNVLDTAIRETCEETGIDRSQIDILGPLNFYVAPAGVIIYPYVALLNISDEDELNPNQEVKTLFTRSIEWFVTNPPERYHAAIEIKPHYENENGEQEKLLPVEELGLPDRYATSWTTRKHRIFVYKSGQYKIWGMTAELIRELVGILKK